MLFIQLFIRLPLPLLLGMLNFLAPCLYGPEKIHFEDRNVLQSLVTLVMCALAKIKKQ